MAVAAAKLPAHSTTRNAALTIIPQHAQACTRATPHAARHHDSRHRGLDLHALQTYQIQRSHHRAHLRAYRDARGGHTRTTTGRQLNHCAIFTGAAHRRRLSCSG